jgi:leucyl-tRNA synthetase
LAEAKEMVYLKGFYEGTMLVGEQVGKSVQEAKPLIKQQLLDRGEAVVYMEPEKTVISRYDGPPPCRYFSLVFLLLRKTVRG